MRSDRSPSLASSQSLLALVILSGMALAISIQSPSKIAAAYAADLSRLPLLFPATTAVFLGVFAMTRGAAVAARTTVRRLRWATVLLLGENIFCAIALLIPYFVFSRAVVPAGGGGIALALVYMVPSCFFFALLSFGLEVRHRQGKRGSFALRYSLYLLLCGVPIGLSALTSLPPVVASLSPIGVTLQMVRGAETSEIVVGLLAPVVGILVSVIFLRRIGRRPHAI